MIDCCQMGSAIFLFFTYSYFSWLQLAGTSPGSPVVKLHASTAGLWVTFLVGEIRCHGMSPSSPKPPQTIQVWVTHNLTIQWWFLVMLWSIFTSYFLGTYLHFFFLTAPLGFWTLNSPAKNWTRALSSDWTSATGPPGGSQQF